MDRCPRCGAQVPLTLGQCPRCGLSRGDSPTSPPGSQVAQRPRSGERSGLVTASLVLVLVVALLAVGGLWVAGAGPFSSNPRPAAQPTPGAPVTVTVTPTQPPTTAVPSAPTPTMTPSSTPSASSLSQVYAQVQSGVGLVGVTTCDGAFTGTGVLVDANTMVTAEHVVDGATTVQVRFGRTWSPATVIGVTASGYTAHAWATFTSHQDPGYGPSGARQATCVNWFLDYDLSRVEGGRWIITGASGHAAQPYTVC